MLEPAFGQELSAGLVNAILLALWAVVPVLVIGYTQQSLTARRIRPEFSLRKSEAAELDRAVLLYEDASRRLEDIANRGERSNGLWRSLFGRAAGAGAADADEFEDLAVHAAHLRATIIRFKRRPLQRLRAWVHVVSLRFAFGRALAVHIGGLALLSVAFRLSGQLAWADELRSGAAKPLVWYPLDEYIFYANAIAAAVTAAVAPLLYLLRRRQLHHEFELEFCVFKDLAERDPRQIGEGPQTDQAAADPSQPAAASADGSDENWFAVLGLSPAATLDEVKDAYRTMIKQSHPDRVQGMSAAFKELAEAETKKINGAYRQALAAQRYF